MNSRIKIVLIVAIMLASVVLSTSFSSAQASGSVAYSPTVFSSGTTVLAEASGGSFGSGISVYFYLSSSPSSSGISGSYIGSFSLTGGSTTLSNAQMKFTIPSVSAGTYYILASDSSSPTSSGAQFTTASQIAISALKPSISVTGTQPTTSATVTGSGWDPSSSVSAYLAGPQGSSIYSTLLGTFTATTSGSLPSGLSFTIPAVASGSYTIVAQETSSSSPNSGITADAALTVTPIISVSPFDISGTVGPQFTVSGYGFPSLATIASNGISVGPAKATNTATSASASGSFSAVASLTSQITTPGFYTVTVQYNSSSYSQANAILVSIPNPISLGFTFTPISVTPNTAFTAMVYNFPAGSQVSINLGPVVLGQVSTDSNGYAKLQGDVPALTAGSYSAVASSSGLYASASVTVASYFSVVDPDGIAMVSTSEYFPSSGHYTVLAYGLTPGTTYAFSDSAASSTAKVLSITSGKLTLNSAPAFDFQPSSNGTLIFTFEPNFGSAATSSSITLTYSGGSVAGYSGSAYGYTAVQPPHFSISYNTVNIIEQGTSETVTVSGIIPSGSLVYPGLSTSYNVYMGTSELSFLIGSSTQPTSVLSSTGTSVTISFTVPATSGLYYLAITYSGEPLSSAVYSTPVVVSYPSTTLSSGSVQTVPILTSGVVTGYYIVGYSFYSPATVKVYYYTETSLVSSTPGLTDGGFSFSMSVSSNPEPSGTYEVIAQATYQSSTYSAYSSYTVYPYFSVASGGTYSGPIGSQFSFTMTSFLPDENYYIYFSSQNVFSGKTSSTGSLSSGFSIPSVKPGSYNMTVVQASSMNAVASREFNVTPSTSLTIMSGYYAFPGQLVNYSWKTSVAPNAPGGTSGGPYYGNVFVTVYFNGSAVFTSPSSLTSAASATYLNGSFQMPNDNAGSYWGVTLSWQQDEYILESSATTTETISSYHAMSGGGVFLGLVSGNGALVTGISQSQVAQITAAVNSSISASLSVPLSELNAKISSINNTVVYLNTSFGTMKSSVTTLDASITALNGTVVTLETTVGTVQTSLSSLNATLESMNGKVATVETSVGTLTGNVTSINGKVVTIQTSLGTLKMGVNSLQNKTGNIVNYGLIIDIVIIALVAVTLGMAVVSLMGMRDLRKRFGMKKE
jgi:hypothetical protein